MRRNGHKISGEMDNFKHKRIDVPETSLKSIHFHFFCLLYTLLFKSSCVGPGQVKLCCSRLNSNRGAQLLQSKECFKSCIKIKANNRSNLRQFKLMWFKCCLGAWCNFVNVMPNTTFVIFRFWLFSFRIPFLWEIGGFNSKSIVIQQPLTTSLTQSSSPSPLLSSLSPSQLL